MKPTIVTIVGTRPEIIRLARVISLLDKTVNHIFVHTGQNNDQNLSDIFLGSKLVSVAHTGLQIPNGTRRLGKLPASIKLLETQGEGAIVSWLENGKNSFLWH